MSTLKAKLEELDREGVTARKLEMIKKTMLRSLPLSDFLSHTPPTWIIKGIIPSRGIGVDYGQPGSGKSFSALDIGMACAQGLEWYGRKVKPCGVVYLIAEGSSGFLNRIKAYLQHNDLKAEGLNFEIIDSAVDLLTPGAQIDEVITAIKDASERIGPVGLLIIDTLNRTMSGGEENSSEDMGAYIRNVQYIADAIGGFALVIHHSGKDQTRGARGHSSAKGNVDIELEVIDDNGSRTLTVRKNRDGIAGGRFGFRLEQIILGQDEDGDPITSCVVIPTDAPKPPDRPRSLSGVERVGLMALNETIQNNGQTMPETSTIPQGVRAVTLDQWKEQFGIRYGKDHDRNSRTTAKAFLRGKEALLKAQHIAISDPYVWPCRP